LEAGSLAGRTQSAAPTYAHAADNGHYQPGARSEVRPRDPGLHGKCSTGYLDRFILTNKRVMVVNGIIRRVAMMQLLRVTDLKYEQSTLGRKPSYSTFLLESAGQDQAPRNPHGCSGLPRRA
jgi:hypothetical protein